MEDVASEPPRQPSMTLAMDTGTHSSNSGTGSQYTNTSGTQKINSGSGSQYNANTITLVQHQERNTNLLADLRITDPRDDKVRIERMKGGLLHDSYRWILDHDDFIRWRTEAQSPLLWIKGDPGKGKTMLLCGIIDELEKLGCEPIYFFCQATDTRINTATAVLRGLLYLLLSRRPSLGSLLREKHEHAGKQLFEDANSWDALCQMLTGILSDDDLQNVVLVIDALDECISGLDQLLDFVVQLSSSHTRVVVSSRNWPIIEDAMVAATQKVPVCLELNEQSISAAVVKYIDHKVEQLASNKRLTDTTRGMVHAYLTLRANDTFLWVALVYQQLADHKISKRHIQTKLEEFPPGLDALYARMLGHVLNSSDAELCRQVLAFTSIVSRPINLAELAYLFESREAFLDDKSSLEGIIGECGSLLTIRGGVLYFVHQSAKDFLLQNLKARDKIMPFGIDHEHRLLLSRSLQLMSGTLRRNIYNLDTPGTSIHEAQTPVPDPLAPARYSCVYWIDHLGDGEPAGEQQYSQIYNFLTHHYLHWLESLSLLRSMSEGIARMSKLMRAVQIVSESSQLKRLVRDALRHMRYHRVGIESAPLQVYCSALIFSPTRSFIRELFRYEEPEWILTKPPVDDEWSACLQTLEGHGDEVNSVVFSPGTSRLASGSSDLTIKLWDTTTGQHLHTMEGHESSVTSVDFSHDGAMLASASADTTVKLWNVTTGRCLKTLSHDGLVFSAVFSRDGTQVASVSDDDTIRVWNATTGQCVHTIEGFAGAVSSVAFSGDGTHLAYAWRETVRIWNLTTARLYFRILTDHKTTVLSMAFTGDGNHLISSDFRAIKIRNSSTGECLRTLEVVSYHFALSHDGAYLASTGADYPVQLWDVGTGQHLRTLSGHGDWVRSLHVALSSDGTQLASVSKDHAIQLWDLTVPQPTNSKAPSSDIPTRSHQHKSTHKRPRFLRMSETSMFSDRTKLDDGISTGPGLEASSYHRDIHSLTLSSDGEQLASLSNNRSIKLWNSKTGQCLQSMMLNEDMPLLEKVDLVFCGSRLHAASICGRFLFEVDIWDVTANLRLKALKFFSALEFNPTASCYSGDGIRFALATTDKVVRLWDMTTGLCSMVFHIPHLLSSLSFSETGSQLHTDIGPIDLDLIATTATALWPPVPIEMPIETETLGFQGHTLKVHGKWILKDSKNILWLPPEYRAVALDLKLSALAIACRSGRVFVLHFN